MMSVKTGGLLALLFIFSVCVRLPKLTPYLSGVHEGVTAHALIAIDNLKNRPIRDHKFRIVVTYPGELNRNINWVAARQMDTNGIGYYVTYPPFAIIFAYTIEILLGLQNTPFVLQLLSLVLHLISALVMCALFLLMLDKGLHSKTAAIIGTLYYVFFSPHLWFFQTRTLGTFCGISYGFSNC